MPALLILRFLKTDLRRYAKQKIVASGLYHDLNKTKDTLILRSNKKINYLYTANNSEDKEVNVRVDRNS